jgi:hypothetical protein
VIVLSIAAIAIHRAKAAAAADAAAPTKFFRAPHSGKPFREKLKLARAKFRISLFCCASPCG